MWSVCFDERNGSIIDATVRTNDIGSLLACLDNGLSIGNMIPDDERVVFPELKNIHKKIE